MEFVLGLKSTNFLRSRARELIHREISTELYSTPNHCAGFLIEFYHRKLFSVGCHSDQVKSLRVCETGTHCYYQPNTESGCPSP